MNRGMEWICEIGGVVSQELTQFVDWNIGFDVSIPERIEGKYEVAFWRECDEE